MKKIFILFLVLLNFSCNLFNKDEGLERKRTYENNLSDLRNKFKGLGLSGAEQISDFFVAKGFEAIPCTERSYNIAKNSTNNAIERLNFVQTKDDLIGFVDIQLGEPILMQNFVFYKDLGAKVNLKNMAKYDFFIFENYSIGVHTFCYNGLWFSEGGSVPKQ